MPSSNPFVEARREWDERYADLVLGKRNRQIAAGGLLAATLILASGIVWQATRSRYIPYIVEVDKLGYALTIPQPLTASGTSDAEARIVRYEIATFIRNARSVSDPQVEQQQLNSLLSPGRSTPRVVDSPSSRSEWDVLIRWRLLRGQVDELVGRWSQCVRRSGVGDSRVLFLKGRGHKESHP